jgi:hypothetical protein
MPAGTIAPARAASGQAAQAPAATNPFIQGSWEYSEVMFTDVLTPGSGSQDIFHNITPGGFLRGILFDVTAASGVLGAGALAADFPWNLFQSISLESVDGTPLLYPMTGYAYYLVSKYCRPWDGDPAMDPGFVGTINAAFRLRFFVETYATLGVLPNTDARAQYRLRFTVAPSATLYPTAPTTVPAFTINQYLETYAQPDRTDLFGRPNQQVPDGTSMQRFVSHEIFPTTGGVQTFKSNRVGNAIRSNIFVFRNAAGARADVTANPFRLRLDNTTLLTEFASRRDYEMDRFYNNGGGEAGSFSQRPTGVYVWPRFIKAGTSPGNALFLGQSWLLTSEASFLQWESNGVPSGGSLEIITEDLAPVGPVAPYFVGA